GGAGAGGGAGGLGGGGGPRPRVAAPRGRRPAVRLSFAGLSAGARRLRGWRSRLGGDERSLDGWPRVHRAPGQRQCQRAARNTYQYLSLHVLLLVVPPDSAAKWAWICVDGRMIV